jgi:hypothetical protein
MCVAALCRTQLVEKVVPWVPAASRSPEVERAINRGRKKKRARRRRGAMRNVFTRLQRP